MAAGLDPVGWLREVHGRRQRSQRPFPRGHLDDDARAACRLVSRQTNLEAGRGRRRRPDRQLHPGDCHFALWFGIFGVRSTEARIAEVMPDTPAAQAGFVANDLIVGINGSEVKSFEDVQKTVSTSVGRPLLFKVRRGMQNSI